LKYPKGCGLFNGIGESGRGKLMPWNVAVPMSKVSFRHETVIFRPNEIRKKEQEYEETHEQRV
jgi:hypothetical protein